MVREGRVLISTAAGKPAFGAGFFVTAYEVGAEVASASSGTTIVVRAGHGFEALDKLIVGIDITRYRSVLSVTPTTIEVDSNLPVADGELLVNLGHDSGATEPQYDSNSVQIYADMDYSNLLMNSTVQATDVGRYRYHHRGIDIWELVRSNTGAPFAIYTDARHGILDASSSPVATDYPLTDVTDVLMRWYRTGDANPLFSFSPLAVSGQYAMLLRVGDRAQTSGDSRALGYFSAFINSPGSIESQALLGINVYTGAGTASQIGVFGMSQSLPGSGLTQASIVGMQGFADHLDTAGGTTTTLIGVSGTAEGGTTPAHTGVAQNIFGVRGNAQIRGANVTATQMAGIYGLCATITGSVVSAYGGRFDQPSGATTNNHALLVYGTPLASLAFSNDLSTFRYLRWSTANTRFELSSNTYTAGTLEVASTATVQGAATLNGGVTGGIPRNAGTWNIGSATDGTDTACSNGTAYVGSVFLGANATVTGIQYLVGSVGGTDKVVASLHNSAGVLLANSDLAGATVGTAAQLQQVAFTGTYAAKGPAWYFVALTFNGTTAKFRSIPAYCNAGSGVIGNGVTQTFGTAATFTAPTTFTADKVPVASLY